MSHHKTSATSPFGSGISPPLTPLAQGCTGLLGTGKDFAPQDDPDQSLNTSMRSSDEDSGYGTQPGSSTISDNSQGTSRLTSLSRRLGITRSSPQHAIERDATGTEIIRFRDLWQLLGPQLIDLTTSTSRPCRPCSAKLKVLGPSSEAASPCIIVYCDKSIAKKVRRLLSKKVNAEQLRPTEDASLPHFDVFVEERPPVRFNDGNADIDQVEINERDVHGTLCGAKIRCRNNAGGYSVATLGGIIWVTKDGKAQAFGLTVAHIYTGADTELDNTEEGVGFDRLSSSGNESDTSDASGDASWAGIPRVLRAGTSLQDHLASPTPYSTREASLNGTELSLPPGSPVVNDVWKPLGHLMHLTPPPRGGQANLDWILVKIDQPHFILPNKGPGNGLQQHMSELDPLEFGALEHNSDTGRRLNTIFAVGPLVDHGLLSLTPSFLHLPPSQEFIEVYTLKPTRRYSLSKGSCGAWIFCDQPDPRVAGIVCAKDEDNEIYVIPLESIFRQVRHCLAADRVSLSDTTQPHRGSAGGRTNFSVEDTVRHVSGVKHSTSYQPRVVRRVALTRKRKTQRSLSFPDPHLDSDHGSQGVGMDNDSNKNAGIEIGPTPHFSPPSMTLVPVTGSSGPAPPEHSTRTKHVLPAMNLEQTPSNKRSLTTQCSLCQGLGHSHVDCPARQGEPGSCKTRCESCGQPGHLFGECWASSSIQDKISDVSAMHMAGRASPITPSTCNRCGGTNHTAMKCQLRSEPSDHSTVWNQIDDTVLLDAKSRGMSWEEIHRTHFPAKSANACRKRHERVLAKMRNTDWDDARIQRVTDAYNRHRHTIWAPLCEELNESLSDVEKVIFEQKLRTLRNASQSDRITSQDIGGHAGLSEYERGSSPDEPYDHTDDSGISLGNPSHSHKWNASSEKNSFAVNNPGESAFVVDEYIH